MSRTNEFISSVLNCWNTSRSLVNICRKFNISYKTIREILLNKGVTPEEIVKNTKRGKIPVRCVDMKTWWFYEFDSIQSLALHLNGNKSVGYIKEHLIGKREHVKGFLIRKFDDILPVPYNICNVCKEGIIYLTGTKVILKGKVEQNYIYICTKCNSKFILNTDSYSFEILLDTMLKRNSRALQRIKQLKELNNDDLKTKKKIMFNDLLLLDNALDENTKAYGYIYCVTCTVNGKQYIGKTILFPYWKRWQQHLSGALNKDSCLYKPNSLLQKAIRKHGEENFVCELIDTANNADDLNAKEMYWVDVKETYNCGYNMTLGGDGGSLYSTEDIEAIIELYLRVQNIPLVTKETGVSGKKIRDMLLNNDIELIKDILLCIDLQDKSYKTFTSRDLCVNFLKGNHTISKSTISNLLSSVLRGKLDNVLGHYVTYIKNNELDNIPDILNTHFSCKCVLGTIGICTDSEKEAKYNNSQLYICSFCATKYTYENGNFVDYIDDFELDKTIDNMILLFRMGRSLQRLSDIFGFSVSFIRKQLLENGVNELEITSRRNWEKEIILKDVVNPENMYSFKDAKSASEFILTNILKNESSLKNIRTIIQRCASGTTSSRRWGFDISYGKVTGSNKDKKYIDAYKYRKEKAKDYMCKSVICTDIFSEKDIKFETITETSKYIARCTYGSEANWRAVREGIRRCLYGKYENKYNHTFKWGEYK